MTMEPNRNQRFIAEAREHLAAMTACLMALERGEGDSRTQVEQLLRAAHSIKGGAGFTGRGKIEALAHAMETAFETIRDRRAVPTPEAIDALLCALDRLAAMIDDQEHSDDADISEPMTRLRALIEPASLVAAQIVAAKGQPDKHAMVLPVSRSSVQPTEFQLSESILAGRHNSTEFLYGVKLDWFQCEREFGLAPLEVARLLQHAGTILDSRLELKGPAFVEGLPNPPIWYRAIISSALNPEQFAGQLGIPCAAVLRLECVDNGPRPAGRTVAANPPRTTAPAGSLRIPVSLIDRMMGLAGELVLVRNQAVHSTDPAMIHLRQLMRRLDSITNELQDAALRMRMQPVGTLFDKFPRLVRDLARQLGKQIDMSISGTEVELDKTILETLSDPLMHLVRNCCDHGIELPDERTNAGKAPTGVINLSARQQGGRILIQIRDDGRGLDLSAIKQKALQRGVRSQEELDRLSDQQAYGLILLSGFSTAKKVTDLSGRGVGMDVVKTNLEQIGGVLEIGSEPGEGTIFTLSLPLTLAIVPCLLLRTGDQKYALPQRDVEEIVLLDPQSDRAKIECSHDREVMRLRGRLVPVTRLAEVLERRQPFSPQTWSEIVAAHQASLQDGDRKYVAVLKFGSQRFGLLVDDLLGSEDIVVMPLHPLLRPLGIYSGATILGDGGVALILSGEGIARHSGMAHRPLTHEPLALPADQDNEQRQSLLLFRCGPAELLAMSLSVVRRVVAIQSDRIQRVGDREMVNIDGSSINLMRPDRLLKLSPCSVRDAFYVIIPRHNGTPVALLASEIVDTPTLPLKLDTQAFKVDGVLGSMLIQEQVTLFLDFDRLLEIWQSRNGHPKLPASDGPTKRVLVVEDTQFFRQLIKNHLEGAGYHVVLATNGLEGLGQLDQNSFDLVVSDIEMPIMDGLTFARSVREKPQFGALPLLALTTLSGEEDRRRALDCGFDAYEIKLERDSFLANVRMLLELGRTTALVRREAKSWPS